MRIRGRIRTGRPLVAKRGLRKKNKRKKEQEREGVGKEKNHKKKTEKDQQKRKLPQIHISEPTIQ